MWFDFHIEVSQSELLYRYTAISRRLGNGERGVRLNFTLCSLCVCDTPSPNIGGHFFEAQPGDNGFHPRGKLT